MVIVSRRKMQGRLQGTYLSAKPLSSPYVTLALQGIILESILLSVHIECTIANNGSILIVSGD